MQKKQSQNRTQNRMHRPLFLFIIVFTFFSQLSAQTESYIVQAAFLERFTQFIEWPNGSLQDNSLFSIGILGENKLNLNIEKLYTVQGIKIRDKNIQFKYFKSIDELESTNILLISKTSEENLQKVLAFTKNKPILTISECPNCANKGIHINFFIDEGSIRFEINNSAVKRSNLSMSYLLLQAASTVITNEGK